MRTTIIRFFLNIWLKIPFGYICRVHHKDAHITLLKNYWVVMSRDGTSDALPITVISYTLQHELALRMKAIGYDVNAFFDYKPEANEDTEVSTSTSTSTSKTLNDAAVLASIVATSEAAFLDKA